MATNQCVVPCVEEESIAVELTELLQSSPVKLLGFVANEGGGRTITGVDAAAVGALHGPSART